MFLIDQKQPFFVLKKTLLFFSPSAPFKQS